MLFNTIKRTLVLFATLLGISAAAMGAILWHHTRLASPCATNNPLNGEPVTCSYLIQPAGDMLSAVVILVVGFAICLLISWLSFKSGRPSDEA